MVTHHLVADHYFQELGRVVAFHQNAVELSTALIRIASEHCTHKEEILWRL